MLRPHALHADPELRRAMGEAPSAASSMDTALTLPGAPEDDTPHGMPADRLALAAWRDRARGPAHRPVR
ncbi:MAG: PrgI family protein [Burkholderiaceae bacterium]|nr:PrgI family protein [Burkholderiaceae bacterium]